jgi:hypothetical protein
VIAGDRGTWRSSTSRKAVIAMAASSTERPAAARPQAHPTAHVPACVSSGGQSPVCAAVAKRTSPDPAFVRNLERLVEIADHSRLLDSRIEYWSWYTGVNAEVRRMALANGYTIRFRVERPGGKKVTLHTICPDEIR